MRTKEKFYENLNNRHVSKEKRDIRLEELKKQEIQKVEFRTVKAVEKAISNGLQSKASLDNWTGRAYDSRLEAKTTMERVNAVQEKKDNIIKELETIEKKFDKEYSRAKEAQKTLRDKLTETKSDLQILASETMSLIEGARSIGVPKPPIVEKAQSLMKKMNTIIQEGEKNIKSSIKN